MTQYLYCSDSSIRIHLDYYQSFSFCGRTTAPTGLFEKFTNHSKSLRFPRDGQFPDGAFSLIPLPHPVENPPSVPLNVWTFIYDNLT